MPFTFSHPALMLPLKYLPKRFYSLTGLVIGIMTPDFEYFLRMSVGSIYSHSFKGLFYFDLPMGILLSFIFHNIVRNELISHLPVFLQLRFWNLKTFDWNNAFKTSWLVIVISIFIGAASHIFWDDFTHPMGYFVARLPSLKYKIQVFQFRIPVYSLLQTLSSLVAGIIVCLFVISIPQIEANIKKPNDHYWLHVSLIVVVVMMIRFLCGLTLAKYRNVIVSLISAFFIGIIISLLIVSKRELNRE